MRILAMILTLALAFVCCQALAGPAGPESLRSRHVATETPRLLTPEQTGAERAVWRVRAPLKDPQFFAARIMAAVFVANLARRNGAGTLALAGAGGALDDWLLSELIAGALTTDGTDEASYSQPPPTER
jgi:hypothetical protein